MMLTIMQTLMMMVMEACSEDESSPGGREVIITFRDPAGGTCVTGSSVPTGSSVSFIEMALQVSCQKKR